MPFTPPNSIDELIADDSPPPAKYNFTPPQSADDVTDISAPPDSSFRPPDASKGIKEDSKLAQRAKELADVQEQKSEPTTPLGAGTKEFVRGIPAFAHRGGAVTLAAMSDAAAKAYNFVNPDNPLPDTSVSQFSQNPTAPLPAEEGAEEMRGIGRFGQKALQGAIKVAPAIGASAGIGAVGVAPEIAGAIPFAFDANGKPDPVSAGLMLALPGIGKLGEKGVAKWLDSTAGYDTAEKIAGVIKDATGKPVSKDTVAAWLKAGGNQVAANAALMASQIPDIAKSENPKQAFLDALAGNLAPSLLAFMGHEQEPGSPDAQKTAALNSGKWVVPGTERRLIGTEEKRNIQPPTEGGPSASGIREDTGQPAEAGKTIEGSKTDSGNDVEQTPSGQSESVAERKEVPPETPQPPSGNVPLTPAVDRAQRLEDLRKIPNRTPEQEQEFQALVAESGSVQQKMAAEIAKVKANEKPTPAVPPQETPPPKPPDTPAVALTEMPSLALHVEGEKTVRQVKNMEEAAALVDQLREASDMGSSEFPQMTIVDTKTGKPVARVSYNGRIWGLDGKEIERADNRGYGKPDAIDVSKETPKQPIFKPAKIERPWDIIDEIESKHGTILNKKSSKPGHEDYYNTEGYTRAASGAGKRLFSAKGSGPDKILQALIDSGAMHPDATVDDLWEAIDRASKARGAHYRGELPEQKANKFYAAMDKALKDKKSQKLTVGELQVGDQFTLGKEKFTVKFIDPDTGEVTVQDGKKFGTQTIPDGADIAVDAGSYKAAKPETASEDPFAVENTKTPPKLRPGEKVGEMFQGGDQPFNLSGETTKDIERIQKEKEAAEKAAAEAKALQEKQQLGLPGTETKSTGPQKYRIGKNPSTYEIVERLPASDVEKENGEQPVKIKNDRTGEVSTVLEQDLTAVQSHAGEEKAAKGPSLDDQLKAYGMDPGGFQNAAQKREAIKRAKAKGDKPKFSVQADPNAPPIQQGAATGVEGIGQLLRQAGYDEKTVAVAQRILDRLDKTGALDFSKLTLQLKQQLEYGAAGLAHVSHDLIQLASGANATTFPHELFHFLFEHLPAERQAEINQYRVAELRNILGDNIPKELADGTLTTEAFLKAYPDDDHQRLLYPLINNSEFLANFAGKEAVSDYEKANDPSKWNQFKNTIKQLARIVVQSVRGALRLRPDMRQIFDELQAGKWRPDAESGKAYEMAREAQAQAPRTLREYEKEKAFNEPLVAERTLGAYGDIADLKNKFADQLGISEQARKNLNLPSQDLLSAVASGDARLPRVAFDNYNQVRILTEHAGPGARWSVIRDAWRGATDELNRMANTEKKFQRQQEYITSKGFRDKMKRAFQRKADADMSQRTLTTFKHQITEQAGLIIKALNEKGKTDAQVEQLRQDLARVQKLGEFGEAVRQRVQDIIDTVAATEGGLDLLYNGTDKTGTKIYNAYLDLKESTAKQPPSAGLAGTVDERFLSAEDKARVAASKLPLVSEDHKLFAKLAAQVLAANTDLRLQLATMQHFNTDPDFAGKVTAVGEKFRKQYEKDPTNAVKQMVKATEGLTKKALDAQTAWLRVNADVTRELKKYQALDEATTVDRMVRESSQWNQRMNLISRDAGSIEVPPSERGRDTNPISPSNVWNEFMGRGTMVGPSGATYEIDLGHTKATADAAQLETQKYLNDINSWLNDPKNATSPYRDYWQMRFDFADASLNVSLALRPPTVESLWWKNPATIPEFFFKGASLPDAKISSMASANYARAWVVADQWYNGAMPKIIYALRKGMGSHGKEYDANFDIKRYQRDVMDRLASEYRHGKALAAGDRLNNGVVLTQQDIKALETIGFHVNELMNLQRNIGREKLMPNTLVIDEWAKGAWGLRAPQELGARKGTTLPHEFSQRAKTLARLVAGPQGLKSGDLAGLEQLLDSQDNFTEFVQRFIAERRADYSTQTPFEDIYKDIAQKWRDGAPDAPQTIQEIVDYIDSNTTSDYDKDSIKGILLGEMDGQIRKFYKDFVEPNKNSAGATTVESVQRDTAFSKAYQKDVGSSFYYDYGAVTAPEIRNMGVDSTNFHLVRLVNTLDALVKSYDTAIAQIEGVSKDDQKAFIKKGMVAFRSGEDFRNWERLKAERRIAQYFKESLPQAYGKDQSLPLELFSNVKRVTGDAISTALSGLGTFLNVSFGSPMKMMLTLGALDRVYGMTYFRGVLNTMASVMRYGLVGVPKTAYKIGKIGFDLHSVGLKEKAAEFWIRGLQEATEGLFRQSEFYDQQYKYGLGFANPVGERIANIIAMPYTHGMGYEAKFSDNPLLAGGQKLGFRALSLAEAPLELVKSYFPQFGYVVSYDAAARTAGQIIDGIAGQARRSFDYLEKSGKLAQWDLKDIKSPKNQQIPSEYVIPGFFTKKSATAQNFAALWWSRAIDQPFHETVLNYWKKLSETKPEDRDKVSFLAADVADPAKVKQVEDARGGALLGVAVKDVHHASPENRPLELRKNQLLSAIFPLAGWFSHSARGVFQAVGKAPTDPYSTYRRLAVIAGITALNVAAMGIVGGEVEKEIKRLMYKLVYHEEFPAKQIWRGGSAKEVAQIALMDDTSFIPLAHDVAAILLGTKRGGEGLGGTVFALSKLNSILDYFKGVIKTGQPTYGVANLLKTMAPSTKVIINQLASQQGLIAARNAKTLLDLYGPEDLRGKGQEVTFHDPTPLTPYRNDLRNAIFSGDAEGVKVAAKAYLDKAVAMGNEPEKAQSLLRSTMSALNLMKMGGKKLTDDQLAAFIGNLTDAEKAQVNAANQNWVGAEKALGMEGTLTAQPPGGSAGRIGGSGAGVTSAYDTGGRTGKLRPLSAGGGSFRRAAIGGGTGRLRRMAGGRSTSAPSKATAMKAPKLRRTTSHFRGGTTNRLRSHHKKNALLA